MGFEKTFVSTRLLIPGNVCWAEQPDPLCHLRKLSLYSRFALTRCFGWIPSPVISCTSGNWFNPLTFAEQIIVLFSGSALNSKLCLSLPLGYHNLSLDPRAAAGITLCWSSTVQEHQAGESNHSKILGSWGGTSPVLGSGNCEHAKLFCTILVLICYCRLLKLNLFIFFCKLNWWGHLLFDLY